jgi:hypothetical protein
LPAVVRNVHVPGGSISQRVGLDLELLYERAVLLEHLDAVVGTVAHVDEPVDGDPDTVDGVAELPRCIRVVAGSLAVGSPVTLVLTGVRIEHDDPPVQITVGDVDLVGFGIHLRIRGPTEQLRIIASTGHSRLPDLEQERPVLGELQYLVIVVAVTGDPHVACMVHEYSVFVLRPFEARSRTSPCLEDVSLTIELHDGRCRDAAVGTRWILCCSRLVLGETSRSLDDPDVILRIDGLGQNGSTTNLGATSPRGPPPPCWPPTGFHKPMATSAAATRTPT